VDGQRKSCKALQECLVADASVGECGPNVGRRQMNEADHTKGNLMIRKTLVLAATLTTLLASAAIASPQQDESRIRCVDSNTVVVGSLGEPMFFTITGYPNDQINTPFYCGPIKNAPNVIAKVTHSGGQRSYRFCVEFRPAWVGRNVELIRNGVLIDRDRIVCW
jgi:hypothetical protein